VASHHIVLFRRQDAPPLGVAAGDRKRLGVHASSPYSNCGKTSAATKFVCLRIVMQALVINSCTPPSQYALAAGTAVTECPQAFLALSPVKPHRGQDASASDIVIIRRSIAKNQ
jgi:hypothetical protein